MLNKIYNFSRSHILYGLALFLFSSGLGFTQKAGRSDNEPKGGRGEAKVFRAKEPSAFEFFEAHALPAAKGTKAVLVLLSDPDQPKKVLGDAAWREFAQQQSFALMSVGYRVKPGLGDKQSLGREWAKLLEDVVQQAFGKGRKKMAFAEGAGAEGFLWALQAKPEAWMFWASKGASNYPLAAGRQVAASFPAGLVMATEKSQYLAARDFFQNLRQIDLPSQRVTFVGSDKRVIDDSFLERFFRQYLATIYAGRIEGKGLWCSIYDSESPLADDVAPAGTDAWLPNRELAGAWRLLNREHRQPVAATVWEHEITTPKGVEKIWVRAPSVKGAAGTAPASVLLWLTSGDRDKLKKRLTNLRDPLIRFAEKGGIPILAWSCASIWKGKNSHVSADSNAVATADQAFIKIGDAMQSEIKKFCRERGWPDKNWLLSADSHAGRYGLMMAQAYPFLAVQLHSASGYKAIAAPPSTPWLVTCGWQEGNTSEHLAFRSKSSNAYWPVLFKRYPKLDHQSRWDQRTLSAEFFTHVLSLNKGGAGSQPWAKEWKREWQKPFLPEKYRKERRAPEGDLASSVAEVKFPANFNRASYAPDRAMPKTIGDWFAEQCRRTDFVGNSRSFQILPSSEQQWVYPEWLVRLPSQKLAEAWALNAFSPPSLSTKEVENERRHREGVKTNGDNKGE